MSSTTCQLDGCLLEEQLRAGSEASCAAVSLRTPVENFTDSFAATTASSTSTLSASASSVAAEYELAWSRKYQQAVREYQVDLKCLACVRNGCNYCQILDESNVSLAALSLASAGAATARPASPSAYVLEALLASSAGGLSYPGTSAAASSASVGGVEKAGVVRLSPRSRCISDPSVCARVPRFGLADSVGVVIRQEKDCYASRW
jgi:hypothetical protein